MKPKIDFKQPRYALPAIALLPGLFIIYMLIDVFGGSPDSRNIVADQTNRINPELPEANVRGVDDKYTEMYRRYGNRNFDSWSGISGLVNDQPDTDAIEGASPYIQRESVQDTEITDIMPDDNSEDWNESLDIQRLEEALARSRSALSGIDDGDRTVETPEEMEERLRKEIEAETEARDATLQPIDGKAEPLPSPGIEEEQIEIVKKATVPGASMFNTITSEANDADACLIKAMIDQTTKAQDGTRIRFKLLDDVTVQGIDIHKGSYLYGTVVGFGTQRVKVAVNSILVNGKFIKVKLAAYDIDGMEGFYVPASAFREFMREAAARTTGTNLQINQGYGSAITGEMLALQALQNVYNAASSAASGQIRKNKAKIKYNTIVYLINSESI